MKKNFWRIMMAIVAIASGIMFASCSSKEDEPQMVPADPIERIDVAFDCVLTPDILNYVMFDVVWNTDAIDDAEWEPLMDAEFHHVYHNVPLPSGSVIIVMQPALTNWYTSRCPAGYIHMTITETYTHASGEIETVITESQVDYDGSKIDYLMRDRRRTMWSIKYDKYGNKIQMCIPEYFMN